MRRGQARRQEREARTRPAGQSRPASQCTEPRPLLTPRPARAAGDQLTRNAFRGTAQMYAADERVLGWAQALIVSCR